MKSQSPIKSIKTTEPKIGQLVLIYSDLDSEPIIGLIVKKQHLVCQIEWYTIGMISTVKNYGIQTAQRYREAFLEWKKTNLLES